MEKQNRAERRRNKFGGGRSTEHGGWPTVQPNPVFSGDAPSDEAAGDAPPPPVPAKPPATTPSKKPAKKADAKA